MVDSMQQLDSESIQASQHVDSKVPGVDHKTDELKPLATEGEPLVKKTGEASPNQQELSLDVASDGLKAEPENDAAYSGELESVPAEVKEHRDLSGNDYKTEHDENVVVQHSGTDNDDQKADVLPEDSQSLSEPTHTDMKGSAEVSDAVPEKDINQESKLPEVTIEDQTKNAPEQTELIPVIEGAHQKEADNVEGADELYSPRPIDEEQPFVSEQDETQTIIGEGSLVGDRDVSDLASNEDSMSGSVRSASDEILAEMQSVPADGPSEEAELEKAIDHDEIEVSPVCAVASVGEQEVREDNVISDCNGVSFDAAPEPVEELVVIETHSVECQQQLDSIMGLMETEVVVKQDETVLVEEGPVEIIQNFPKVADVLEEVSEATEAVVVANDSHEEPQVQEPSVCDQSRAVKKEGRPAKRLFGWCSLI